MNEDDLGSTSASFRTDAVEVPDKQHADHQLGINRWPAEGTVEGLQMRADEQEINEQIN